MYIQSGIFEYLKDSHIKLQMDRCVDGKEILFKSLDPNILSAAFYAKKARYKNVTAYQFNGRQSFLNSNRGSAFQKSHFFYETSMPPVLFRYLFKTRLNIILPFISGSPTWYLPFRLFS
jgi:hypothetical protein